MNTNRRGFTLVEMLVALALLSLMSVAMLQAYRLSQRSLLQVTTVDAGVRDIASAQRFLRRVLEQAYPFEPAPVGASADAGDQDLPRGLTGTAQRLEVTAPALAAEGSAGLYRFAIRLEEEKGKQVLAVAWGQDRNGVIKLDSEQDVRHEVILADVESVSISYLELVELGDGQIEAHWRDSWLDKATLPALVRVQITFSGKDARRWPELVVAPRISTDANCVFDVVSQMCRMPA